MICVSLLSAFSSCVNVSRETLSSCVNVYRETSVRVSTSI